MVTEGGCTLLLGGTLLLLSGGSEAYAAWRDVYQCFDEVTTKLRNAENDFLNFVGKVASTPAVIGESTRDWLVTSLSGQASHSVDIVNEIVDAITDIQRNNDDVETSWMCWVGLPSCIKVPDTVLENLGTAKTSMSDFKDTVYQAKNCIVANCQSSTMQMLLDQKGQQLHSVCNHMKAAACEFAKVAHGHTSFDDEYCYQSCSQSKFQTKMNLTITLVQRPLARPQWKPKSGTGRFWMVMAPSMVSGAILTAWVGKRRASRMLSGQEANTYRQLSH